MFCSFDRSPNGGFKCVNCSIDSPTVVKRECGTGPTVEAVESQSIETETIKDCGCNKDSIKTKKEFLRHQLKRKLENTSYPVQPANMLALDNLDKF